MSSFGGEMDKFRANIRPEDKERFLFDSSGNIILDDNGKPMINRNANRVVWGAKTADVRSDVARHAISSESKYELDHLGNLVTKSLGIPGSMLSDTTASSTHAVEHLIAKQAQAIARHADEKILEALQNHEEKQNTWNINHIPPEVLISHVFKVFEKERILAESIRKLGYQPTTAAITRTADFISASCVQAPRGYFGVDDMDGYGDEMDDDTIIATRQQEVEQELNELCRQLKKIPLVSRARLIYCEFPETASISVQFLPDVFGEEESKHLQDLEQLIIDYKPKGLAEIELSITNKVVY